MKSNEKPAHSKTERVETPRRDFLKTVAAGSTLIILPSGTFAGAESPNNKLNIALIGAHGCATAHYDSIAGEDVVALCDVDENHLALTAEKFPNAKHYVDWRKCLEQKELDAVVCCTTDHTHPFIALTGNQPYNVIPLRKAA